MAGNGEIGLQMKPSLEGLIAWLETQPGAAAYEWFDVDQCIIGKYLAAMHPKKVMIYSGVFQSKEQYFDVCRTEPHTFGAALERARAALPSADRRRG